MDRPALMVVPLWLALAASVACACSGTRVAERGPGAPGSARALAPGPLLSGPIRFRFVLFFLPAPTADPVIRLDALLTRELPTFRRLGELPAGSDARDGMFVAARQVDARGSFTPPGVESLKARGRGLSREQGAALQASRSALVLDFRLSRQHGWEGLRGACRIASRMAQETGGLVRDAETREVFSPGEWDQRRLAGWTEEVPDVARHVAIDFYQKGGMARGVSFGMAKLGLPDLVVSGFPWSSEQSMGNLINSLAQALAEGAQVGRRGELTLRLKDLRNAAAREPELQFLMPNARGEARLRLLHGRREEGDPENRLIEIGFDRYPGSEATVQQEALLAELFGVAELVVRAPDDAELLAASRRARERLPSLQQAFARGLPPGEAILLKAPFTARDGTTEWMWVEVSAWHGREIKGVLMNKPVEVSRLHAGQTVTVSEDRIFDYIHRLPDGTEQGNETGSILEKREGGE